MYLSLCFQFCFISVSIFFFKNKFLEISHLVPWKDDTLKVCLWSELDDYYLQLMPVVETTCNLAQYIEYALWLSRSSLTVNQVKEDSMTDLPQTLQSMIILQAPNSEFSPYPLVHPGLLDTLVLKSSLALLS